MDKVQKPSNPEYYSSSSELLRIYTLHRILSEIDREVCDMYGRKNSYKVFVEKSE
jgi:hypothetical protein